MSGRSRCAGPARHESGEAGARQCKPRRTGARTGVAFLVVTVAASAAAAPAAAQFASVAVTAQVAAPDQPVVAEFDSLAAMLVDDLGTAPFWIERAEPRRPYVTRSRMRSEPRAGSSGAGLVLDVVMDYTGI